MGKKRGTGIESRRERRKRNKSKEMRECAERQKDRKETQRRVRQGGRATEKETTNTGRELSRRDSARIREQKHRRRQAIDAARHSKPHRDRSGSSVAIKRSGGATTPPYRQATSAFQFPRITSLSQLYDSAATLAVSSEYSTSRCRDKRRTATWPSTRMRREKEIERKREQSRSNQRKRRKETSHLQARKSKRSVCCDVTSLSLLRLVCSVVVLFHSLFGYFVLQTSSGVCLLWGPSSGIDL